MSRACGRDPRVGIQARPDSVDGKPQPGRRRRSSPCSRSDCSVNAASPPTARTVPLLVSTGITEPESACSARPSFRTGVEADRSRAGLGPSLTVASDERACDEEPAGARADPSFLLSTTFPDGRPRRSCPGRPPRPSCRWRRGRRRPPWGTAAARRRRTPFVFASTRTSFPSGVTIHAVSEPTVNAAIAAPTGMWAVSYRPARSDPPPGSRHASRPPPRRGRRAARRGPPQRRERASCGSVSPGPTAEQARPRALEGRTVGRRGAWRRRSCREARRAISSPRTGRPRPRRGGPEAARLVRRRQLPRASRSRPGSPPARLRSRPERLAAPRAGSRGGPRRWARAGRSRSMDGRPACGSRATAACHPRPGRRRAGAVASVSEARPRARSLSVAALSASCGSGTTRMETGRSSDTSEPSNHSPDAPELVSPADDIRSEPAPRCPTHPPPSSILFSVRS